MELRNLSIDQQEKIINYFYDDCDMISFYVPNYRHSKNNNLNISLMDNGKENKDFVLQNDNALKLIKDNKITILKTCNQSNYGGSLFGYMVKVYYLKPNSNFKDLLIKNPFSSWVFPDYPEDIILYMNNKPIIETVAHENIVFLRKRDIERLYDGFGGQFE